MAGDGSGDRGPTGVGHAGELHGGGMAGRLNWLRAGVLGANDGIVSTAGLVVGVAGASSSRTALLVAGLAGLVAGALSMAGGEYVSVSTQSDTEQAAVDLEKWELTHQPEDELTELTEIYVAKGLTPDLAEQVAEQLTQHGALSAHVEAELGLSPDQRTSAVQAALSSMIAFSVGALLPLVAILLPPPDLRVAVTGVSVTVALVLTGYASARLGRAPVRPAIIRNVTVGLIAMVITYGVGSLVSGL